MLRPYGWGSDGERAFVGATHWGALDPPLHAVKEGEAMPRPYGGINTAAFTSARLF